MGTGQDAHFSADVGDPLARAVAENDEGRPLEREAQPTETERNVPRSAEVLDDDDLGWILTQGRFNVAHPGELGRLDTLRAARYLTHADPGLVVEPLPLRVDGPRRNRSEV